MKVDIFLVKDEYSTVANFRSSVEATEYAAKSKQYTVERVEIELPKFRYYSTVKVEKEVKVIKTESDNLDDVIDTHLLNVYRKNNQNKTHTAKALGLTYKTVLKRLKNMGEV